MQAGHTLLTGSEARTQSRAREGELEAQLLLLEEKRSLALASAAAERDGRRLTAEAAKQCEAALRALLLREERKVHALQECLADLREAPHDRELGEGSEGAHRMT